MFENQTHCVYDRPCVRVKTDDLKRDSHELCEANSTRKAASLLLQILFLVCAVCWEM